MAKETVYAFDSARDIQLIWATIRRLENQLYNLRQLISPRSNDSIPRTFIKGKLLGPLNNGSSQSVQLLDFNGNILPNQVETVYSFLRASPNPIADQKRITAELDIEDGKYILSNAEC